MKQKLHDNLERLTRELINEKDAKRLEMKERNELIKDIEKQIAKVTKDLEQHE